MINHNFITEKNSRARILIIDDDEGMCYTLSRMAREEGHTATVALTLEEGLALAEAQQVDVVFLDVRLPDGCGLDLIPSLQALTSPPEIIIITGYGDKGGAKTALKSGVWDYIEKPARINSLKLSLKRALQYRTQKKTLEEPLSIDRGGVIGQSSRILMCLTLMSHAAKSDANVLISGETGTGKELFARAIHNNSIRSSEPFIVVDCTSLPHNLAESILFGHAKGAFTGAEKANPGLIKKADRGTLFLDEIGELPLSLQKKFLRVLQEKKFRPVGAEEEVQSNFRLVSATNRDLDVEVEKGRFRQDLLFRLRTFMIELPALRDRKKDIREIVDHHVDVILERSGQPSKTVSEAFYDALITYDWPGNIRELLSAVESALAMEPACPTLYPKHIPEYIRTQAVTGARPDFPQENGSSIAPELDPAAGFPTLKSYRASAIDQVEKQYLVSLMKHCGQDVDQACALSGLKRARLYQLLKKYEIRPGDQAFSY